MKGLQVSPELALPVDAATETFGILAKKGAGKSNAAVVMAEEMFDAGVPWVAVDPKGDWWGLRSSGDGQKAGLPIVVFGGRHGDIQLEPTAGRLLADLILAERMTCVLDVSEFSTADVTRFLLAFADRLYRQAEAEPLHLFLEEAHEYLPQMVRGDKAPLVGAWQKIVKMGRTKGLGVTLISQRSAALNKDVLTQVDTLIVLQTTSPQDRAAVKAWIDVHSDHREALESLPSLDKGEAWVWSPSFLDKPLQRIRFRRRRTFDSGATPKVGHVRKEPATLADVDLVAIEKQMAATIEKAYADDPKLLRQQLAELRSELARKVEPKTIEKIVEVSVPVIDEASVKMIRQLESQLKALIEHLETGLPSRLAEKKVVEPKVEQPKPAKTTNPAPSEFKADQPSGGLRKGARRMLEVLARHRDFKVTRAQLATLARFSSKGGTFNQYLGDLKRGGFIVEQGGILSTTDEGFQYLGVTSAAPQTTQELLEEWSKALRLGERKMLEVLVDKYPSALSRAQLAEWTEFEVTGGTFNQYLGVLRRNGLIEVQGQEVKASETLFLG